MLQKVLQLYASQVLSKRTYAKKGKQLHGLLHFLVIKRTLEKAHSSMSTVDEVAPHDTNFSREQFGRNVRTNRDSLK